jgi:addiction module RelE/StbE family toxin
MWRIFESDRIPKEVRRIPKQALQRYEKWKDIVRLTGPEGLRMIRGFHDEALKGGWNGFRSSRLNLQYRVIYRVKATEVSIFVITLNPHDYRR